MPKQNKGTALIIAMVLTLAIVGLTSGFLVTTFNYHSFQKGEAVRKQAEYLAIEAAERLRNIVYNDYRNPPAPHGGLKPWLASLRDGTNANPSFRYKLINGAPNPAIPSNTADHDAAFAFAPNQSAWITAVSSVITDTHWVEITSYGAIEGAGIQGGITRSTVIQRISFGKANIFQNALLTKTINCMGCHLQVRGDVGTLGFFRPGWGNEGVNGHNSGNGSFFNGNLYAASHATYTALKTPTQSVGQNSGYYISNDGQNNLVPYDDGTGPNYFDARRGDEDTNPTGNFKVNGLKVNGNLYTTADTIGDRLPADDDGDGERDFPNIDPVKAKKGANGTIGVGDTDPTDGSVIYEIPPGATFNPSDTSQIKDSLSQTSDGSIVLIGTYDKPIQLNGDIFAEGDVIIKGYVEGQGAVYAGRNLYVAGDVIYKNPPTAYKNSSDPDADAVSDISAGKDELRLAARNTIVIGDFTYKNDAGTSNLPISQRQGEDFIQSQFALKGGNSGVFRKGTGEELSYDGSNYVNDIGEVVPSAETVTKSGNAYYDAVIEPVRIDSSGNSSHWISEAQVRGIMGTESLTMNTWRGTISGSSASKKAQLQQNGFTSSQANAIVSGGSNVNGGNYFVKKSGSTYRVIRDTPIDYVTSVGRIDAFLYASKRVAGKTSGKNLVINGGIIGETIGILAPGRKKEGWMGNSRYNALNPNLVNPDSDEVFGKFTINYDYRLRNGGLGFDLLKGEPGRRLFFSVR